MRLMPTSLSLYLLFLIYPHPSDTSPLSLHDALPISRHRDQSDALPSGEYHVWLHPRPDQHDLARSLDRVDQAERGSTAEARRARSEEHTSELQSRENLVCRLLLEKKKKSKRLAATLL